MMFPDFSAMKTNENFMSRETFMNRSTTLNQYFKLALSSNDPGLNFVLENKSYQEIMDYCGQKHQHERKILSKYFDDCISDGIKTYAKKDNSKSDTLRKQGNIEFLRKNLVKSLDSYYSALNYAETDDKKALCYGNISAVFFESKQFQCCLDSIEKARKLFRFTTEAFIVKTTERQKKCEEILKQHIKQPKNQQLQLSYPQNPRFKQVINCIEERSDGGGLFAKNDLKVGDIIAITEPIMRSKNVVLTSNCKNCLKDLFQTGGVISCEKCTNCIYCCLKCKDDDKDFHDFVCQHINRFISFLPPYEMMAFKFAFNIISKGVDIRSKEFIESKTNCLNWSEDTFENKMKALSSLKLYSFGSKIKLHITITKWWIMLEYLKKNSSMESLLSKFKNGEELFFQAYFKCLQIIVCKKPTLEYFCEKSSDVAHYDLFYGLFNHSCAPNVLLYRHPNSDKTHYVIMEDVKPGQQLFVPFW